LPSPTHNVSFRNNRLAGNSSLRRIVGSALTRPLIASTTPVMLITLFESLQGRPITDLMKYGFLLAFAGALGWTMLQLARTPAVILFREGRVRIRTLLALALRSQSGPWQFVIDLKRDSVSMALTLGHRIYELKKSEWNEFAELSHMLEEARRTYDERFEKKSL
jgi:hypothetical protein